LVGYARASTKEQGTDPRTDELRAAGCGVVHEEHASGGRPQPAGARPLAERDLARRDPGLVRLARLAHSVSHLVAVIHSNALL
jgi:DNA invertase Pin-like site-specific DNA recombinase